MSSIPSNRTKFIFMVHKHQATHLHYDLRIEIEGTLASWAVKKLPTRARPSVSAIRVSDHPMWYRHFEGVIPEGTYGAGPVMVWDKGIYTNLTIDHTGVIIPVEHCLTKGVLLIFLEGHKFKGTFALVKVSKKQRWILTQLDGFGKKKSQQYYRSVKSNKTLRQILKENSRS